MTATNSIPAGAPEDLNHTHSRARADLRRAWAIRCLFICHLGVLGVSIPFLPVFLGGRGLTGLQMAMVLSAAPVMHMAAPFIWGWLSDRRLSPRRVVGMAALIAAGLYLPFPFAASWLVLGFLNLIHQGFATALPGLLDGIAVTHVRETGDEYGRIRAWGSAAFIVSCFSVGELLSMRQEDSDPLIPWAVAGGLAATALSAAFVGKSRLTPRPSWADAQRSVRDRRVVFVLVMAAVHWGTTAPFHAFFPRLIADRGLSPDLVGHAFVVSVVAEVLAFLIFRRLRKRLSLASLFCLTAGISGLRWLATPYCSNPELLVAIQALHGFTFGIFWATSIAWLSQCIPEALRSTGQTLLTAFAFGAGYLAGTLSTGLIYDITLSTKPAFLIAGVLSLTQAIVLHRGRHLAPTS